MKLYWTHSTNICLKSKQTHKTNINRVWGHSSSAYTKFTICNHVFHMWSATEKSSNRHFSYTAVCNSVRLGGGVKRFCMHTTWPRAFQRLLIELRSASAPATLYVQSRHTVDSRQWSQIYGDAHYHRLNRNRANFYSLQSPIGGGGSKTSSRYQTSATESHLKICMLMWYSNESFVHRVILPLWNPWCSVMFWGWLYVLTSLQTLTRLSSVSTHPEAYRWPSSHSPIDMLPTSL